jgi:hypothetical protein
MRYFGRRASLTAISIFRKERSMSQSLQDQFPATDVVAHIEIADGRPSVGVAR